MSLALRRMAALLGGAWLAVGGYGVVTAPAGSFRFPLVAMAAIGVGLISSVVVGLSRSVSAWVLVSGAAVASLAGGLITETSPSGGESFVVFWLPGLVAASAGLLMTERIAVGVGLSAAAASSVVVLLRAVPADGWQPALVSALASITYTVCDGLAAMFIARALRAVAAAADQEMTRAEVERVSEVRALALRRGTLELSARLHDSVINTLSAVAVRGDVLEESAVRRACGDAAATARRIAEGRDEDLGDPVGRLLDRIGGISPAPGPTITLTGADRDRLAQVLARMPSSVACALAGGVNEALSNVARHSGQDRASVEIRDRGPVEISVRDEGVGFDGRVVQGRGLALSVMQRCAAAGIEVELTTAPGRGVQLDFRYDPDLPGPAEHQAVLDSAKLLASVRRPLATQFSYCLLAMSASLTVITSAEADWRASWSALALLCVGVWLGATRTDDHGWLRLPATLALVAVIPLVVVLPGLGETGCARVGQVWWGPDGALVPLVLLVSLSRRWWWVTAGLLTFWAAIVALAWTVQGSGCSSFALLSGALECVVVAAMSAFRVHLARLARVASAASGRVRAARLGLVANQAAHRFRDAEIDRALRAARDLLHQVAMGDLTPRDRSTRDRCLLLETHLRQLTQLHPDLENLGVELAGALSHAYASGVRLVLRVGHGDVPTRAAAVAVGSLLRAVIDTCSRGDSVTLAQLGTGAPPLVTITAPVRENAVPGAALDRAEAAGWTVRCADLIEQRLVELRWTEVSWAGTDQGGRVRALPRAASGSGSSMTTSSSATG